MISQPLHCEFARADSLAGELKELQGELGDYNIVIEKVNTNTDLEQLERQCQDMKLRNQRESQVLDDVFVQRQTYFNLFAFLRLCTHFGILQKGLHFEGDQTPNR
jgi:hypothetical protein